MTYRVGQVIDLIQQNEDLFVDSANCINLTAVEEYIASETGTEYGTDAYSQIEDVVFSAERVLVKRMVYNE